MIFIRFLKDGRSQTRFLSILPLNDGKAETITTSLTTHLRELHLPLDRMCAFGSDGAPVMVTDHFNLPVDATLHNWRQVRGSLQGTEKKAEEAMEWVTIHLRNSHDQLYKLAAVGLLLPTSTAGRYLTRLSRAQ
ncbi:hypothetical protein DPMN_085748 [Dreissena polymorpha]|uniref:Uncharacterized protein n=1 Tax=Dreissena polymorpha TaxID=45954 RepID=A0A9D4BKJ6_DREPO|nr:hypothetical protein DPMN_085748 [Dreissena polymorpha]